MQNINHRRVDIAENRFVLPNDALKDLATRLPRTHLPSYPGSGWEQGVPTGLAARPTGGLARL